MATKTIDKNYINSLPQMYKDMGERRFFNKMAKDRAMNDLADMLLARNGVLITYRAEYKEELNHLISLNKAITKYIIGSRCTFWTYLIQVMNCNMIDYARKKAVQYKRYIVTDEFSTTYDGETTEDIEEKINRSQTEEILWKNVNSKINNLHTEIIKLKAAGFIDKEIRKRLKIKQSDIEEAKLELFRVYEVEL